MLPLEPSHARRRRLYCRCRDPDQPRAFQISNHVLSARHTDASIASHGRTQQHSASTGVCKGAAQPSDVCSVLGLGTTRTRLLGVPARTRDQAL